MRARVDERRRRCRTAIRGRNPKLSRPTPARSPIRRRPCRRRRSGAGCAFRLRTCTGPSAGIDVSCRAGLGLGWDGLRGGQVDRVASGQIRYREVCALTPAASGSRLSSWSSGASLSLGLGFGFGPLASSFEGRRLWAPRKPLAALGLAASRRPAGDVPTHCFSAGFPLVSQRPPDISGAKTKGSSR